MAEYRDIGRLNNGSADNVPVDTIRRSQVYQATHGGDDIRLPFMNRSFISFTYGGKYIEDFDLIATISGDRLNRPGYASFVDTVTTYDNLDGQHYWATHYQTNQLDFTLSTDGIDQQMLDNFLHWFKAGVARELVLSEHPNRAIMARVAEPPTLNLLPFEKDVELIISGNTYKTKTTLFKGDIALSLIMDSPHWYALANILGKKVEGINNTDRYIDVWDNPFTGETVDIFTSKDALKILYEDGIPLGSMIDENMLLGNGAYANVTNQDYSKIWSLPEGADNFFSGVGARIDGTITAGDTSAYEVGTYLGRIAGPIVDASNNGIESLSKNTNAYFFYAGTAPAPTEIGFTLQPTINSSKYINIPKNTYTDSTTPYNIFVVESNTTQTLQFTTPNLYTSYNKTLEVFKDYVRSQYTWEEVRAQIRAQVHHSAIRAWAMKCIEFVKDEALNTTTQNTLKTIFPYVLYDVDYTQGMQPWHAIFEFNSDTGKAKGWFKYRIPGNGVPASVEDWATWGTNSGTVEEDVGDMLLSNYIILQDRNKANASGKVVAWHNDSIGGRYNSHRIYHDVNTPLTNLTILYRNMYL